jgi:hypothetical protein
MQTNIDVFYSVHGVTEEILRGWSPLQQFAPDSGTAVGFISAERLLKLREFVNGHPLASEDRIKEQGLFVCEEEKRQQELLLERARKRKKGRAKEELDTGIGAEKALIKRVESLENRGELNLTPQISTEQTDIQESVIMIPRKPRLDAHSVKTTLLASSPIASARIGTSTSPKLNYILNEVCMNLAGVKQHDDHCGFVLGAEIFHS